MSTRAALTLIVLLAAILRLAGLSSESLWLDEGVTLRLSTGAWSGLSGNGTQGPLFTALIKLICAWMGYSEFTLRLLPALLGIAVVPLGFLLSRKLFGETAALLTALVLAVNPFLIHYSQDARPYTLFLLGALGSAYFVLPLAERGFLRDAVLYAIFTNVAVYAHPFAVFLLPSHILAFAVWRESADRRPHRAWRLPVWTGAATLLIALPQLTVYGSLFLRKFSGGGVAAWIEPVSLHTLRITLRHYFASDWIALFAVAVITLSLLRCARGALLRRLLIPLAVIVFSVLLPWAISLSIAPIYVTRYGIPGGAALFIILGWALSVYTRPFRKLLIGTLLITTAVPLYSCFTRIDKDPFRQTAALLRSLAAPGDAVLCVPSLAEQPLAFYLQDQAAIPLLSPVEGADPHPLLRDRGRIWRVDSYLSPDGRYEAAVNAALMETHIPDSSFRVNDRLRLNRYAYHIVPVTVTRYVPRGP